MGNHHRVLMCDGAGSVALEADMPIAVNNVRSFKDRLGATWYDVSVFQLKIQLRVIWHNVPRPQGSEAVKFRQARRRLV